MEMTPDEIRRNYRQAKDPQNQIQILADLNVCSVAKIKNILGKDAIKTKTLYWTDEKSREFVQLRQAGAEWEELADIFDVTVVAAKSHYGKVWKQYTEDVPTYCIGSALAKLMPRILAVSNFDKISTNKIETCVEDGKEKAVISGKDENGRFVSIEVSIYGNTI